ncbi:MAG: flippase [Candidatus Daviesbacteria bacterium]|nr:flippase [Candidatus Daviesbacteria bacterium]
MQVLLKISQQTFWQILGKVVTAGSTFVILGLVARSYGEEGTGVFTLALTYLAIFYLLSDFGFNAHVLKRVSSSELVVGSEWNKLLGTRIVWSVVLVLLAVGTLPLWPFATGEFFQAVIFGSLAIIGSGIFVTCNLIFQSKLRYDLSVLASSAGTLISLAVFIYLISSGYPVPLMLLAHLAGWIIIALMSLILVSRIFPLVSPVFDSSYAANLFRQSWPIAATLALNVVYFRADSFMIAYFRSNTEVGVYNVAYSVFQTTLVLPTFIMNAYYPMMLKSFKGIKVVVLGLLVVASFGTMLTLTLAPLIIQILTGGGFVGATSSLQILSLGFPAYFLSALLMWVMVAQGRYRTMLIIYAIGLAVNLVLNFIYIPQYSFVAASYITVISEYLILIMQGMVLWRRI